MDEQPEEIVVREFSGGVNDGELEFVGPNDSKDDVHRRRRYWPDDDEDDLPEAEAEDVYVFSHEEVTVVRLRKWVFARKTKTGPASAD